MNISDLKKVYKVVEEKFVIRKAKDEIVIVPLVDNIADMTNVITLNAMATEIFEMIDGKNSLETIVLQLLNDYNVSEDVLKEDISIFITTAEEKGIIQQTN